MSVCTPKSFDLTGKVALITGASYGISQGKGDTALLRPDVFHSVRIYAKSSCATGRMTSSRSRAAVGWPRWSHSRMTV